MEPFDLAAMRRALHDWLRTQTGLQVIWGHQNAPVPPCPFASLTLVFGPRAIARLDEVRFSENMASTHLTARGPRTLSVSCGAYAKPYEAGKTATDYLLKAQASLRLPSVRTELGRAGLTVLEDMGVCEIPEVVSKSWISRAHMDVRFTITSQISEPVETIENVGIAGGATYES
jgi:hypothetical protein